MGVWLYFFLIAVAEATNCVPVRQLLFMVIHMDISRLGGKHCNDFAIKKKHIILLDLFPQHLLLNFTCVCKNVQKILRVIKETRNSMRVCNQLLFDVLSYI